MRLITPNSLERVEPAPTTPSDQVLESCASARQKIEIGDYDAGCAAIQQWWTIGEWPKQVGLSQAAAAELLLTAGTLNGWVATTRRTAGGQKSAELLLSGAVALFDNLGATSGSAEGRVELGFCDYRQGAVRYCTQYPSRSSQRSFG